MKHNAINDKKTHAEKIEYQKNKQTISTNLAEVDKKKRAAQEKKREMSWVSSWVLPPRSVSHSQRELHEHL